MIHDISSLKPTLLVDVAYNNYSRIVFNTLLKHDNELPDGHKNNYFIHQYKELENRYFKKFFRICKQVDMFTGDNNMEDIAYDVMDSFETAIKPALDNLEQELRLFLLPDMNDPENIFLLRKIQINSVLLQLADKLSVRYNEKKDSLIIRMLEINTLMTEKIDDRIVKRDYNVEELNKAGGLLLDEIIKYKYDNKNEMEDLQRATTLERGRQPYGGIPVGKGTARSIKDAVLAAENLRSKQWFTGRRCNQITQQ